jgi:hypothetical protein
MTKRGTKRGATGETKTKNTKNGEQTEKRKREKERRTQQRKAQGATEQEKSKGEPETHDTHAQATRRRGGPCQSNSPKFNPKESNPMSLNSI